MTPSTDLTALVAKAKRAIEAELPEDEPDTIPDWCYETIIRAALPREATPAPEPTPAAPAPENCNGQGIECDGCPKCAPPEPLFNDYSREDAHLLAEDLISPYESGVCCMARHIAAKPPWTCDCACHAMPVPPPPVEDMPEIQPTDLCYMADNYYFNGWDARRHRGEVQSIMRNGVVIWQRRKET